MHNSHTNKEETKCTVTHVSSNRVTSRQRMSELCMNTDTGPACRETCIVEIECHKPRQSQVTLAAERIKDTMNESIEYIKHCEF